MMLKVEAVSIRQKLRTSWILKIGIAVASAFLLANSTLLGSGSPLVVSLIGALGTTSGIFAFLGALLCFLFTGQVQNSIVQLIAMLLILLGKLLVCEVLGKELKIGGKTLLSAVTYLSCGLGVAMITSVGSIFGAGFVVLFQSILVATTTYFLLLTFRAATEEGHLILTGKEGAALGVVFLLLTGSLCSVVFGIVNVGRVFGLLVVLIAAKRYRHLGGALCASLVVCGAALYSQDLAMATMLLPIAALVAGIFSEFGTLPTVFFFLAANAVGLIIIGVTPQTVRLLVDALLAGIAFVIIPDRLITRLVGASIATSPSDKLVGLAASKLSFAAKTIGELRSSVQQISKALERQVSDSDVVSITCDNVCVHCRGNLNCWEKEFDRTFEGFSLAKKQLETSGEIAVLPAELEACFKKSELMAGMLAAYHSVNIGKKAERKMGEMRGLLTEQFIGMEDMLFEISEEITNTREYDEPLSKKVRSFLSDYGAIAPRDCVFLDNAGKLFVEAFYTGTLSLSDLEIAEELSDLLDRELELPQIFIAKEYTKLCLMEKPPLALDIGKVNRSVRAGEASGDSCEQFYDGRGNAYFILSDGMGSGKLAAIDSLMTASLLIRLLKAGLGIEAGIRLINASLLVKSANESFATLDIACINLYTGRLELVKLGAAATFVKTGGRVTCVEASSMPIGILDSVQTEKRTTTLHSGDVVAMISDGVRESFYPLIKQELLNENVAAGEDTSARFVEKLVGKVTSFAETERIDDITIFCIKIIRNLEE